MADDNTTIDEAPGKMTDYLIFESSEPPGGFDVHGEPYDQRFRGMSPYACLGAVRATDPEEAIRAVIAHTRRVGKYAVIEAYFLDFAPRINEPEGQRPVLNP